jgi:hypothetical protein
LKTENIADAKTAAINHTFSAMPRDRYPVGLESEYGSFMMLANAGGVAFEAFSPRRDKLRAEASPILMTVRYRG